MHRGTLGFWTRLAIAIVKPPTVLLTRRRWKGQQPIPAAGRIPRFQAKGEVFTLPILGRIVRGAGQIPVHRNFEQAGDALVDAAAALQRGECVGIYPEGTTTRDPAYWPMRARTGVARLALRKVFDPRPLSPVADLGTRRTA